MNRCNYAVALDDRLNVVLYIGLQRMGKYIRASCLRGSIRNREERN